jgi:hypothetical protein
VGGKQDSNAVPAVEATWGIASAAKWGGSAIVTRRPCRSSTRHRDRRLVFLFGPGDYSVINMEELEGRDRGTLNVVVKPIVNRGILVMNTRKKIIRTMERP